MMEARPEACPVWTSALEGRGVTDRTLGRCVVARRHRQSVFCVAKKATGWSCGQRQTANALGVAAAAIQRSGYLQRCVVVGNDCREGTSRLRDYFLHLQLGLGWMVEVAVEAEAADVQLAVWLMRESRSLRQLSHIDAERLRGVLELLASRVSASVERERPRILVESLDTDRVAVRAVTEAVRCCQSA